MKMKIFSVLFSMIVLFSFTIPTLANISPTITRLAGEDRYDTAVTIAKQGWIKSDYAVLAYGENFPDALSAAVLARKYNAPILLTNGNNLLNVTKQTLLDLQVKDVFIIGGTSVIPSYIESELQSIGIAPTRIAGLDRYETAIKIAQQLNSPSEIIVTTGEDYPDALSIAPIAAIKQIPIILVPKDYIPDSIKSYLSSINADKTYVIGDPSIIHDSVFDQFPNAERIVGADKYERNIAINNKFNSYLKSSNIGIATGEGFADALTGAAYAAQMAIPIILVNNSPLIKTENYYQQRLTNASNVYVFGGTAVVSDILIQELGMSIPQSPKTCYFKDKNLENVIRKAINKSSGDIAVEDIQNIEVLKANDSQIYDLSGIENCTGLYELYLDNNQISDISPLKGLSTYLAILNLNNNQISDITPLKDFTSLFVLHLDNNQIKNQSSIENMIIINDCLEEVSFDNNHFETTLTPGQINRNMDLINNTLYNRSRTSKITLIDNIEISVDKNDIYTLPSKVFTKLYQGVPYRNVAVKWDKLTVDASKPGTYVFSGKVYRYDKQVILTLEVLDK